MSENSSEDIDVAAVKFSLDSSEGIADFTGQTTVFHEVAAIEYSQSIPMRDSLDFPEATGGVMHFPIHLTRVGNVTRSFDSIAAASIPGVSPGTKMLEVSFPAFRGASGAPILRIARSNGEPRLAGVIGILLRNVTRTVEEGVSLANGLGVHFEEFKRRFLERELQSSD